MGEGGEVQVLAHVEALERAVGLEGAGDAVPGDEMGGASGDVLRVQQDVAGGGGKDAGDQRQQGGFAGAVGADDAEKVAALDSHVQVLDGAQAAEVPAEAFGFKQRWHWGSFGARW